MAHRECCGILELMGPAALIYSKLCHVKDEETQAQKNDTSSHPMLRLDHVYLLDIHPSSLSLFTHESVIFLSIHHMTALI